MASSTDANPLAPCVGPSNSPLLLTRLQQGTIALPVLLKRTREILTTFELLCRLHCQLRLGGKCSRPRLKFGSPTPTRICSDPTSLHLANQSTIRESVVVTPVLIVVNLCTTTYTPLLPRSTALVSKLPRYRQIRELIFNWLWHTLASSRTGPVRRQPLGSRAACNNQAPLGVSRAVESTVTCSY